MTTEPEGTIDIEALRHAIAAIVGGGFHEYACADRILALPEFRTLLASYDHSILARQNEALDTIWEIASSADERDPAFSAMGALETIADIASDFEHPDDEREQARSSLDEDVQKFRKFAEETADQMEQARAPLPRETHIRSALVPIVGDAFKRARRLATEAALPDTEPFVTAIIETLKQIGALRLRARIVPDKGARSPYMKDWGGHYEPAPPVPATRAPEPPAVWEFDVSNVAHNRHGLRFWNNCPAPREALIDAETLRRLKVWGEREGHGPDPHEWSCSVQPLILAAVAALSTEPERGT